LPTETTNMQMPLTWILHFRVPPESRQQSIKLTAQGALIAYTKWTTSKYLMPGSPSLYLLVCLLLPPQLNVPAKHTHSNSISQAL